MLDSDTALVVFSGGQDSTTCLYWAKQRYSKVYTVSFDYGQKHKIELEAAKKITELAGVNFDLVTIPEVLRSTSPLVDHSQELEKYKDADSLPGGLENTFVPGRNILFLTIAANIAYAHKAQHIVTGICQEDFGGYYDCREDFALAMQKSLNQGMFGCDQGFVIETPLMHLTKAESVKLAAKTPGAMQGLAYSHTCYDGKSPPCMQCHSCLLRDRGFEQAGYPDPLIERHSEVLR